MDLKKTQKRPKKNIFKRDKKYKKDQKRQF